MAKGEWISGAAVVGLIAWGATQEERLKKGITWGPGRRAESGWVTYKYKVIPYSLRYRWSKSLPTFEQLVGHTEHSRPYFLDQAAPKHEPSRGP